MYGNKTLRKKVFTVFIYFLYFKEIALHVKMKNGVLIDPHESKSCVFFHVLYGKTQSVEAFGINSVLLMSFPHLLQALITKQ